MIYPKISSLAYTMAFVLLAVLSGCPFADTPKAIETAVGHDPAAKFSSFALASDNTQEKGANGRGRSRGLNSGPDTTPPSVTIGSPSSASTATGPITYLVSYNDASTITLGKRDVSLNATGSAAGSISVSGTEAKSRSITISNITGNGTLGITIAPGTAVDAAGNLASGAGPSTTVQVENPAPTLTIGEPSDTLTNTGPVSFTIQYTNATAVSLTEQDITLSSQEGVTGSVTVSGTGSTERTVTIDNITGIGMFSISVAPGTAQNAGGEPASGAGPSASVDVYGPQPTLEPGPGFDGPTPQPDAIGTGPGSDAKAIARWDVVPYQTFDGIFQIGVVAFHINGIDRVEFSLEGGPWTAAIPVMTRNPLTDVVEYWVNLDASMLPDGPIEVRAIAYPAVGIPRVLSGPLASPEARIGEHSLCLNSNFYQTLPRISVYVSPTGDDTQNDGTQAAPFRTIWKAAKAVQQTSPVGNADGGIVFLMPGEHRLGTSSYPFLITSDRWLTLKPAPEAVPGEVVLTGADLDGLRTKLVCLDSLTLRPTTAQEQWMIISHGDLEDYFWLRDCRLIGPGQNVDGGWGTGLTGKYFTGCSVSDCRDAPSGDIVRDMSISNIGSDAFGAKAGLIANCTVTGINPEGTTFHADVLEFHSLDTIENHISYHTVARNAYGQGFASGQGVAIKDIAIVDCVIDNQLKPNYARVFQFCGPTEHLYVLNSTFNGPCNWRTDFQFTAHNVVVEHCEFSSLPTPTDVPGVEYRLAP